MNASLNHSSRRNFIKKSLAFGGLSVIPSHLVYGKKSSLGLTLSNKVNVAAIGIGNKGAGNVAMAHSTGMCNIVALCDVDLKGAHTQNILKKFNKAKTFTDFRKMFDAMADDIDAVLISTPDHSHFAATMLAMSLGKHVYVEKPLAHTFGQCERMIQMAEKNPKLITQMGNQGHSGANYFQFKAWSEAGLIKDVTRITAHMNKVRRWHDWGVPINQYPQNPMPDGINWDQWIDSANHVQPFSQKLHPQEWRSWYDYGSGCFGDWGPHILDTCHRFLKLGLPEKVTADLREGVNASGLIYPQGSTIKFKFSERGVGLPACVVKWYDGVKNKPILEGKYTRDGKDAQLNSPGKIIYGKDLAFQGGSHGSPLRIVPREKYIEMRDSLPQFPLKNSNHYENFLLSCMDREKARSPFSVAGPLTQVFNLGIISQRLGGEIQFDREKKQITNNSVANALLDPEPRKGWEQFYTL